jgi:hypothetical protein
MSEAATTPAPAATATAYGRAIAQVRGLPAAEERARLQTSLP